MPPAAELGRLMLPDVDDRAGDGRPPGQAQRAAHRLEDVAAEPARDPDRAEAELVELGDGLVAEGAVAVAKLDRPAADRAESVAEGCAAHRRNLGGAPAGRQWGLESPGGMRRLGGIGLGRAD